MAMYHTKQRYYIYLYKKKRPAASAGGLLPDHSIYLTKNRGSYRWSGTFLPNHMIHTEYTPYYTHCSASRSYLMAIEYEQSLYFVSNLLYSKSIIILFCTFQYIFFSYVYKIVFFYTSQNTLPKYPSRCKRSKLISYCFGICES